MAYFLHREDVLEIEQALRMEEEADICIVGSGLFQYEDTHVTPPAMKELMKKVKQP